jgi:hypothetical protein
MRQGRGVPHRWRFHLHGDLRWPAGIAVDQQSVFAERAGAERGGFIEGGGGDDDGVANVGAVAEGDGAGSGALAREQSTTIIRFLFAYSECGCSGCRRRVAMRLLESLRGPNHSGA